MLEILIIFVKKLKFRCNRFFLKKFETTLPLYQSVSSRHVRLSNVPWWSFVLVKRLPLQFTVTLPMILKIIILRNFFMILRTITCDSGFSQI